MFFYQFSGSPSLGIGDSSVYLLILIYGPVDVCVEGTRKKFSPFASNLEQIEVFSCFAVTVCVLCGDTACTGVLVDGFRNCRIRVTRHSSIFLPFV